MLWVVKRRWWILAGGLALFLLGIEPPGPGTDFRSVAGGIGIVLVLLGLLGVVVAIPIALKARRAEPRSPRSS
jgi:hypothetical protein